MLNVIIVDDDRLIREDLVHIIDWNLWGLRLVGQANNGLQAMEILKREEVDIVITDISMPKMDGITLIKKTMDMAKRPKILVISNYDDFELVKEALKNGAVDYILKYSIKKENIMAQLNQIKELIRQEDIDKANRNEEAALSRIGIRAYLTEIYGKILREEGDFNQEILHGDLLAKPYLDKYSYGLVGIELSSYQNKLLAEGEAIADDIASSFGLEGIHQKEMSTSTRDKFVDLIQVRHKHYLVFVLLFEVNSYLYIMEKTLKAAGKIDDFCRSKYGQGYRLAVKEVCFTYQEMIGLMPRLINLMDTGFYQEEALVLSSTKHEHLRDDMDMKSLDTHMSKVVDYIYSNEFSKSYDEMDKIYHYFSDTKVKPELVRTYYNRLVDEIVVRMAGAPLQFTQIIGRRLEYMQKLYSFSNLKVMHQWLLEIMKTYEDESSELNPSHIRPEIQQALEYMAKNYAKNISLDEISNLVGVSKNHFCRMFKDNMDENYTAYLNSLRIRNAISMMRETNDKIQVIALDVGYSDYRYFCRIFKKETGVSPSEYRKSHTIK